MLINVTVNASHTDENPSDATVSLSLNTSFGKAQ